MVDFGELKAKAQGLIADHSDQVKQGIDKIGNLVGDRIGHDKVNQVEDKLSGLVDKIAGEHHTPSPSETPAARATVPTAAEPPAAAPPGPDPVVPPAAPGSAG